MGAQQERFFAIIFLQSRARLWVAEFAFTHLPVAEHMLWFDKGGPTNRDPKIFAEWAREETKRVLATQRKDGSWTDRRYGSSYATAMNCLFLALPDGLLPIFQR